MKEFAARIVKEQSEPFVGNPVCHGTLLSRIQYEFDLLEFADARTAVRSEMSNEEIQRWVEAGSEVARHNKS
jgi:hypothetical protein